MKRVLMIAFHYPPLAFGSGILRTLSFVWHLPASGWTPAVLTVHQRAHEKIDVESLDTVSAGVRVERAFTLDAKRDLSICGRYLEWTARPDRWATWRVDAVRRGLRLIEDFKPDVIWSTYPVATAHSIGHGLHAKSGIPWIADFRDPMLQDDYPQSAALRRSFGKVERNAVSAAKFSVFSTPGAVQMYRARYPALAERMVLLENGYEEANFASLPQSGPAAPSDELVPVVLLHSGIVYPEERDPAQLFEVLARLERAGTLSPAQLRIRFRASHHEEFLHSRAKAHNVAHWLDILPPLPHHEALLEMMQADALLVLQARNCNAQIPAKLYEYLRTGRPVMALTDPQGDTAATLLQAGVTEMAQLDSVPQIEALLPRFVSKVRTNTASRASPAAVKAASRGERAKTFAALLERASNGE